MKITEANAGRVSAVIYTSISTANALAFLAITVALNYEWVASIGGALWVWLLSMIILMPTVMPVIRASVTGERVSFSHDHEAMMREERSKEMAKDPVCGMEIEAATAAGSSEYKGQTYYFCNLNCKKSFDEDPEKYVTG